MNTKKRYLVDLFAGCGGLSLGLENAGFIPILVNELANEALATYLENRKGKEFEHFNGCQIDNPTRPWVWKNVIDLRTYLENNPRGFRRKLQDIHGIDIKRGELDLVVGGPPCQGYSGIGIRRSYAVDKQHIPSNHMYENMIAIIDALQPKIFLFENVKGLLSARWYQHSKTSYRGDIWYSVRQEFKGILGNDYEMGWHLVHAYEYGVPQNRPRVLLAGIRKDLGWSPGENNMDEDGLLLNNEIHRAGGLLPNPTGKFPTMLELLDDLVDENFQNGGITQTYPKPATSEIARSLRTTRGGEKILDMGEPVTEQKYSRHSDAIAKKFQYMIDTGGEIKDEHRTKKFAQRLLPREWPNGKPTVTATSLPDDYVHYKQPRILTVREWARLQMFPDWYLFKGKRTTGGIRRAGNPRESIFDREVPKYTQIGNAVPVRLAEAVGHHFINILNELE